MKFLKKHYKGLIILLVVVAALIGLFFYLRNLGQKTIKQLTENATETAYAEKRDLVSVVAATGKVVSKDTKNATSIATGAKVLSVKVGVGDTVKEGDVIAILDSSDFEKSLENVKSSLEITQKMNALQVNSAQRNYNNTVTNSQITMDKFTSQVEDSDKTIKDATDLRDQAETLYKNAVSIRETAQKNYDDAVSSLSELKKKLTAAKKSVSGGDTTALDALSLEIEKTQILITTYSANVEGAKAAESAQLANYQSYKTTVDNLEKSRDSLNDNIADTKRSTDASIEASKDSLTSAKLQTSGNTFSYETQIENLEKQINECVILAPTSGIITSMNIEEGTVYAGMPAAVIEDISAYEISTEIDEYDIGKIKVGQEVKIKTNGTEDEEFSGKVISIAPRATMSMGAGVSGVTYAVNISLDSKDERIKLDMTAKLSIVLSKSEKALTVPYDAVFTDDEGEKFVKIYEGKNEDGSVKSRDVYVTTGIETDYYAEILSGDIKDGDEIVVEHEASNVFNLENMFGGSAMGGM